MDSNIEFNEVLASKRLSRLKILVNDEILLLNVIWCRTAYAYNDNETWNTKDHRHSFFELHYVVQGKCAFKVNQDIDISLSENQFYIVPPQMFHHFVDTSEEFVELVMGFNIQFKEEHPDSHFFKNAFNHIDGNQSYPATERMRTLVSYLLVDAYQNVPGLVTSISSILELFITEITRQITPHFKAYSYDKKLFETDRRVESAKKFIKDNISIKITCLDVAKQLNISVKQLNRIVKNETTMSINELIESIKVKRVCHLLENTQLTLDEIAEQVGYSNAYNLSRFFKRVEGLSPGKYRKSIEQ